MGANSLWTNPTNWDRLAVPDANTDVVITNTGGKHVVLNADTTVASVTVGGDSTSTVLDLVGVNLHADGMNLISTNGTIEVISNSSISSTTGLQNSGVIYVPANSGTVSLALNCNFSNSRTVDVETNSTLRLMTSISVTYTLITGTTFSGPAAAAYDIQVSTNLTDWTTIESNSPFSGEVLFTDTNSASSDHRFYRSRIFE